MIQQNSLSPDFTVEARPDISWGAIFAGAFVAFVVNVALISLGSGIGFTSFDPSAGDSVGRGTAIWAGIFALIAGVLSILAGGFVASRMAGFRQRSVAGLHGLCAWAVVSTFSIIMISMGIGNVASAAFGLVGRGISGVASIGASAAGNIDMKTDPRSLMNEAKQILRDTGKPELRPENLQRDQAAPIANAIDQDAVASVIARRTGMSEADAKSLLGQSEDKAREVWGNFQQQAKTAGLQAAEKASDVAAAASWFTFAMLVLGALAGYFGGILGRPYSAMIAEEEARDNRPIPRVRTDRPLNV